MTFDNASDYTPELAVEARRMCLHVATILGDILDEIVVVGGLVPYLIIDQTGAPEAHVGTRDLDLGLSLAVLDDERYREISARLRDRGFEPGRTEQGNVTRQTWTLPGQRITIDFLIPRVEAGPSPGKLQSLEGDFAAIVTAALPLAFTDYDAVTIDDSTLADEVASRTVNVCGPAAFVAMKAHAIRLRAKDKDAYDLVYVLKHYGDGTVEEVASRYVVFAEVEEAKEALDILRADFASEKHLGAVRAARFRAGRSDPALQADAFGYVQEFLKRVGGG
jgi:predicted nucleotidyltransferase